MSTIKVSNIQHGSAASAAITLDANGQATLNGLAFPTSGSLGGRNRIINGDMRIDQRNAGAAVTIGTTTTYTLDRWATYCALGSRLSIQRSTAAPAGFTNSLLATSLTATTPSSSDAYILFQQIEGFNWSDLGFGSASAKSVTLSFWVRSSLTGTFGGSIKNNAETQVYPFSYAINAADTWEQKSITIPGSITGTWNTDNSLGAGLTFDLGCGTSYKKTAGAWANSAAFGVTGGVNVVGTNGATFYITGVQLEAGTVATPFERRSYGQELMLCQRYCCQFGRSQIFTTVAYGFATSTTVAQAPIILPVEMRTSPTSITSSGSWQVSDGLNGFAITSLTVPGGQSSTTLLTIQGVAGGGGLVAHRPIRIESANNTTAYILVSAEL